MAQSCVFGALELENVGYATVVRRFTQACVINPVLIACYVEIYFKVKRILHSQEIIIFFIAIIQFLIAMSTELLVLAADNDTIAHDRLADIIAVLYLFSSVFLIFGVSLSIRKALDMERKCDESMRIDNDDDSIFLDSNEPE